MYQDFFLNVSFRFKQINFQIINIDEIELFRDYTSSQFNYPFKDRNNIVTSFDLNSYLLSYDDTFQDYNYLSIGINYMISQVCLEDPIFNDIDIYNKVLNEYQGFLQSR